MNYNSKTVPVKISRSDLCDILVAITSVAKALESDGYSARKWEILNNNLKEQLAAFDAKNGGNDHEQN